MTQILRTTANNPYFVTLVEQLDADLALRDGEEHGFYSTYNGLQMIEHVILATKNGQAIGCGALKRFNDETAEIKRMYVIPEARKNGVASLVLKALENWAHELGFQECILETGKRQPEAIALYQKRGYCMIANYGQYAGFINSVCFQKNVSF